MRELLNENRITDFRSCRLPHRPDRTKKAPQIIPGAFIFVYGDGGSRTRVRKPIRATFSGCRPSFVLPAPVPGGQGTEVGSRLLHDGCKGKLTVHVRC